MFKLMRAYSADYLSNFIGFVGETYYFEEHEWNFLYGSHDDPHYDFWLEYVSLNSII